MRKILLIFAFVTLLLNFQIAPTSSSYHQILNVHIESEQPESDMPDVSHALLVEHAALSHGLAANLVGWLSQGAWDEDHCSLSIYPPGGPLCFPGIPNGHHSWDPDTNQFWTEPSWWGDFGPGLSHAVMLFGKARDAYQDGDTQAAYLWLGRTLHMIGDVATPAHTLLDSHLPFDPDSYEDWLSQNDYENTESWISANPPESVWDLDFHDLPAWDELSLELQTGLEAASLQYGGRLSGQELWEWGPQGEDKVIFQLMYLVAEEADNFDSDDIQGEKYHGNPSDPTYLAQIRTMMFPLLVQHSTALISYFEGLELNPPAPQLFTPQDTAIVNINPPSFTWEAVGFEPTYQIEIDVAPDFGSPLISESITETSFTPPGPLHPGIYYWRVQASTAAGTGEWSETWQFSLPWQVYIPLVSRAG